MKPKTGVGFGQSLRPIDLDLVLDLDLGSGLHHKGTKDTKKTGEGLPAEHTKGRGSEQRPGVRFGADKIRPRFEPLDLGLGACLGFRA